MSKVTDIGDYKLIKDVGEQTGFTPENSNIVQALEDAKDRGKMYQEFEDTKARALIKKGEEPYPCCNMVCKDYKQREFEECIDGQYHYSGRKDYCTTSSSHGCLFQMKGHPPNSFDYDKYMPTHQQALDMLEKHELLKGERKRYEEANATYDRAASSDERHNTEVKGITFTQLARAIETAVKFLIEENVSSPVVFSQNICVEVEKAMGIYPNIKLK